MKETEGDLFEQKVDAVCITTNGFVKKNGEGVMGRGVALQAKQRWPKIAEALGQALELSGNHVQWLAEPEDYDTPYHLVSFPVKENWMDKAKVRLIKRSINELLILVKRRGWLSVALPRPGCGNGGLDWKEVKPILASVLDDRFVIVQN